jgi:hypothetical protein
MLGIPSVNVGQSAQLTLFGAINVNVNNSGRLCALVLSGSDFFIIDSRAQLSHFF